MSDREKEIGRLADRAARKQTDSDEQASEPDSTGEADVTSNESAGGKHPSDASDDGPEAIRHVKDRPSVYMYLPKEYSKDIDIACQMINLTYQRETGDKLPKNRYLYPIVMRVGFENATDLSFDEIQSLKAEIDDIDADEIEM